MVKVTVHLCYELLGNISGIFTGGGGVLGSNVGKGLLRAGVKVLLLDISKEKLEEKHASLTPLGELSLMVCNVLDFESLQEA